MEMHQIHPELLRQRVRVLVVGCGGNGSGDCRWTAVSARRCWRMGIQRGFM